MTTNSDVALVTCSWRVWVELVRQKGGSRGGPRCELPYKPPLQFSLALKHRHPNPNLPQRMSVLTVWFTLGNTAPCGGRSWTLQLFSGRLVYEQSNSEIRNTVLLTYLLTYSMVQSPSWEANWFAGSEEIPRISRNPKFHYRTHKCPPPFSILGQPNPVHMPTSHLLEILVVALQCVNLLAPELLFVN